MSEVFSKAEDNRAPRAATHHPATARYGDGGEASPCARDCSAARRGVASGAAFVAYPGLK